jgi:hypothetical protein
MQHAHRITNPKLAGSYRLVMNNIELNEKEAKIQALSNDLDQVVYERDYYRGKYNQLRRSIRDEEHYSAFWVDKIRNDYELLQEQYISACKR